MGAGKRNECLDFWKGVACFGVVFFHTKIPDVVLDGVLQSFFRFAMPLFFMISGYYTYYADESVLQRKMPAKIKHIWNISLIGCVYYFFFHLAIGLFGDSHGSWSATVNRFAVLFTPKRILEWIVFNNDPFINIMWFTFALMYCYIILYMIDKYHLYRRAYAMIPLLIGVNLFLGNILYMTGVGVNKIYYRNYLFYGLPFLLLGNWLHRNHDRVCAGIKAKQCVVLIWAGAVVSTGEWFLYGRQELYVGSLFMVAGIFCYSMLCPTQKASALIAKIGSEYSLFVYIVHYSLISVFDRVFGRVVNKNSNVFLVYEYLKPLLIFMASVIMAVCFYHILRTAKRRWNKR